VGSDHPLEGDLDEGGLKALVTIGFLALFVACGSGCQGRRDYTRVAPDRTPLVEPFQSYATLDEVLAQLRPYPNAVHTASPHPPGDPRPRWDDDSVEVDGYVHLEHRGRLVLSLFNNRLGDARFYPDDARSYLAALRGAGFDLVPGRDLDIHPYTRVWTARDYRNAEYVGWLDSRLDEEHADWIERHS
jgi:hypothetical protein